MARVICSESVPCGDGMRSTTTYDSEWCEHKEDRHYCRKCNVIEEKRYRLTKKEIRRIFNIPKDFKIQSVNVGYPWTKSDDVIIYTKKVRRRK